MFPRRGPGRNANPLKSPVITARQVTAWSRGRPSPRRGSERGLTQPTCPCSSCPLLPQERAQGDSRGPEGARHGWGHSEPGCLGGTPTGLLKAWGGPVSCLLHVPQGWLNTHKSPSLSSPRGLSLLHVWARSTPVPGSHQTQGKGCSWLCRGVHPSSSPLNRPPVLVSSAPSLARCQGVTDTFWAAVSQRVPKCLRWWGAGPRGALRETIAWGWQCLGEPCAMGPGCLGALAGHFGCGGSGWAR